MSGFPSMKGTRMLRWWQGRAPPCGMGGISCAASSQTLPCSNFLDWVCLSGEGMTKLREKLFALAGRRQEVKVGGLDRCQSSGEEQRWSALEFPPWQVILLHHTHHILNFKKVKFKNYFLFLFQWKAERNKKTFVRTRFDAFANGCTTHIVPEGCCHCLRGRNHTVLKGSKIWNFLALLFHCQDICQSQEMFSVRPAAHATEIENHRLGTKHRTRCSCVLLFQQRDVGETFPVLPSVLFKYTSV